MQVELEALACHRGGRMVFRDLSFSVPAGSAVLVRGPNGVGKSTLLRVLAGLIPAATGQVVVDGKLTTPADLQEQTAYAGHLDAVKPALSVAQNLSIWADLFGAGGDVSGSLRTFGLDGIAERPVAQCSAGQKRRLGLARLLVVDRPLWLLDEPTVSLDADSASLVAKLVTRHCADGGTAFVATHIDLDLPAGPVLSMEPAGAAARPAAADAFLDGAW